MDQAHPDLERKLSFLEKRLCQVASLLSESEAENVKLQQLTQVLKEEIRTYQRAEERKKHIDNLEYVKNVILKVTYAFPIRLFTCVCSNHASFMPKKSS